MIKKIILMGGALILCATLGFAIPYFMSGQTIGTKIDTSEAQAQFEAELSALREKSAKAYFEARWDEMAEENNDKIQAYIEEVNEGTREVVDEVTVVVVPEDTAENVILEVNEQEVEEALKTVEADEPIVIVVEEPVLDDNNDTADSGETVTAAEETVTTIDIDGETAVVVEDPEVIDLYELETIPLGQEEEVTEAVVKDAWVNAKIEENREEINDGDLAAGAEIYNQLDTNYLFGLAEDGLTPEEDELAKAYLRENLSGDQLSVVEELYHKYVHLLD